MTLMPVEDLLSEARRKAGLQDFVDEDFRPALEVLWTAMHTEANLTELGLERQRQEIIDQLVINLRLQDYLRRHPEIETQPIVDPLFIVATQRSGSTKLHRLTASDPQWNVLYTWQTLNPIPLGELDTGKPDPRIALAEDWCKERAFLQAAHSFHPQAPEMESYFLGHYFAVNNPWRLVPSHQKWLESADLRPAYRYLKKQLQFLQWQTGAKPGRRWLLKATSHLLSMNALMDVFPDGKFVMTHRHPKTSVGSMMQLTVLTQKDSARSIDRDLIRDQWVRISSRALQAYVELSEHHPERCIDIAYRDIERNALDVVRNMYRFANAPFTAETQAALIQWEHDNPRHKDGKFHYDIADFGLSDADMNEIYKGYLGRFGSYI